MILPPKTNLWTLRPSSALEIAGASPQGSQFRYDSYPEVEEPIAHLWTIPEVTQVTAPSSGHWLPLLPGGGLLVRTRLPDALQAAGGDGGENVNTSD